MLIQRPRSPLHRSFFLFQLAAGVWLFSMGVAAMMTDPTIALLFAKIGLLGVIFIPITTYAFSVYYLNDLTQQRFIIVGLLATIIISTFPSSILFATITHRFFYH